MKVFFTPHFQRSYQKLTLPIQQAFQKQLAFLLRDRRHPSLQAKKYDEATGIWQARVTGSYRFYFTIHEDTYILHEVGPHRK